MDIRSFLGCVALFILLLIVIYRAPEMYARFH